ncbi:vasotab-like [Anopheles aquasalis]|uniref:vasotab-like n=1 Tax=Anopheles aquasalis TaxID=42839 RepID=UPI00215A4D94|nr:vasotab-like [Anopheles aquasalis]XP_050095154.1 vasotab-like [Anopheles aquasalis]
MRVAIVLLAVMALICAMSPVEGTNCDILCTADESPVCGVSRNGQGKRRTFGNRCNMDQYNCDHNKDYIFQREGEC